MKIITYYECEICRFRYNIPERAQACEAQSTGPEYPVGTIFNEASGFYKGITFVIAANQIEGHSNRASLWAFRDNHAGDSLGLDDICGSNNGSVLPDTPAVDSLPTFTRAVQFLRKHKMVPLVWDGKRALTLKEWAKR